MAKTWQKSKYFKSSSEHKTDTLKPLHMGPGACLYTRVVWQHQNVTALQSSPGPKG